MKMGKLILFVILFDFSTIGFAAKKDCTNGKEEDFKKKIESQGNTIIKFKTPGNCYEIYGKDKVGKNFEKYYNPINGTEFTK